MRLADHPLLASYRGTLEWYLHQAGMSPLFLDLRKASRDDFAPPWLSRCISTRHIGANVSDWQFRQSLVADEFDGMVFFDSTTPSTLLGKVSGR